MIEQGSPEWFATRCGKVTASRVSDVIAQVKSGPAASRKNYLAQLVAERLTGTVEDSFKSSAMQWGTDNEAGARNAYAFYCDASVTEVGFVDHPVIHMAGASPDGLVGNDGLVEIKCPNTATHIESLSGQAIAGKYIIQMQWQMACAQRGWCDFASYDPRLPEGMRLHVVRVARDNEMIAHLEMQVVAFLKEVDDTVSKLMNNYKRNAA